MSGISTNAPIALVESKAGGGIDIETYKSALDCVLSLINNGRLGTNVNQLGGGWGSDKHAAAVHHVIQYAQEVEKAIAAQQLEDAAIDAAIAAQQGDSHE